MGPSRRNAAVATTTQAQQTTQQTRAAARDPGGGYLTREPAPTIWDARPSGVLRFRHPRSTPVPCGRAACAELPAHNGFRGRA